MMRTLNQDRQTKESKEDGEGVKSDVNADVDVNRMLDKRLKLACAKKKAA